MSPALGPLWAGLATLGFALLFGVRPRDLPLAAAGSVLGWAVYALLLPRGQSVACFAAAAAVGIYAETAAALMGRPATVFVVCAIIPLVPGGGMYHAMLESARGNVWVSIRTGVETLMAAGAIAAGLAVAGALARLLGGSAVGRAMARRRAARYRPGASAAGRKRR